MMKEQRVEAMQLEQVIRENMRGFGNYLLDAGCVLSTQVPYSGRK